MTIKRQKYGNRKTNLGFHVDGTLLSEPYVPFSRSVDMTAMVEYNKVTCGSRCRSDHVWLTIPLSDRNGTN